MNSVAQARQWKQTDTIAPREGVITSVYRLGQYEARVTSSPAFGGLSVSYSFYLRGLRVDVGADRGDSLEECLEIAQQRLNSHPIRRLVYRRRKWVEA